MRDARRHCSDQPQPRAWQHGDLRGWSTPKLQQSAALEKPDRSGAAGSAQRRGTAGFWEVSNAVKSWCGVRSSCTAWAGCSVPSRVPACGPPSGRRGRFPWGSSRAGDRVTPDQHSPDTAIRRSVPARQSSRYDTRTHGEREVTSVRHGLASVTSSAVLPEPLRGQQRWRYVVGRPSDRSPPRLTVCLAEPCCHASP